MTSRQLCKQSPLLYCSGASSLYCDWPYLGLSGIFQDIFKMLHVSSCQCQQCQISRKWLQIWDDWGRQRKCLNPKKERWLEALTCLLCFVLHGNHSRPFHLVWFSIPDFVQLKFSLEPKRWSPRIFQRLATASQRYDAIGCRKDRGILCIHMMSICIQSIPESSPIYVSCVCHCMWGTLCL